jgi:hypothetical protein
MGHPKERLKWCELSEQEETYTTLTGASSLAVSQMVSYKGKKVARLLGNKVPILAFRVDRYNQVLDSQQELDFLLEAVHIYC